MSVFEVNLHNGNVFSPADPSAFSQGLTPGSDTPRTVYCPGPNLVNRILVDGQTFTDCNYWKQFAYPNLPLNEAFIEVLTDDGSIYEAGRSGTYPVVYNLTIAAGYPGPSTYTTLVSRSNNNITGNYAPILDDTGSAAQFVQITNTGGSGSVNIRLNGSNNAVFPLAHGDTQVFNTGDVEITLIEVDNSTSGNPATVVQIIASVLTICGS